MEKQPTRRRRKEREGGKRFGLFRAMGKATKINSAAHQTLSHEN